MRIEGGGELGIVGLCFLIALVVSGIVMVCWIICDFS